MLSEQKQHVVGAETTRYVLLVTTYTTSTALRSAAALLLLPLKKHVLLRTPLPLLGPSDESLDEDTPSDESLDEDTPSDESLDEDTLLQLEFKKHAARVRKTCSTSFAALHYALLLLHRRLRKNMCCAAARV